MSLIITCENEQVIQFLKEVDQLSQSIELLMANYKPILDGQRFLTDTELSQYLKLTKRTLQEYRNIGKLPFYQIGGKILYRESDIEQLLLKNRVEAF
ncbi:MULTISPECIES: helix-turn-helix domain-containing protein [unclassified Bacteroides]|jgi:excisionase family DNA binding protein|uniref:helix-turn-helix domain-containing protein n=1 Tax=unclassified Bacteroides TaxID=2646097 RepID=UPI000E8944D5|nr:MULTISPECIES: helix-turn-helix domain-containing protein [unclassified Bacteroides]RGN59189.1 DNA-binding protein [Bacteroides sp. OM05-10AA]RGQ65084.1 DNA-binding protein [Bacteroides sp. AF27-33]